ncbi:MAG: SH3 domain-containing C40 family peptidase [Armatimonadota bacterium]
MKHILLCILAVFALACIASADGVVTLELETPSLQKQEPKHETKKTKTSTRSVNARAERKSIGRIGMVNVDKANIYAKKSTSSRVYSVCLKDTTLAITTTSGSWYGIMMIDGSTGWIAAEKITLLDYQAVLPDVNRGSYASRGGFDGRRSDNPIVLTALQYLGVPYVYGGNSTTTGIDCSAFVRMVYKQFGVNLPRVSRDQANVGTPVAIEDIQPGDRLYFACKHSYVDHCGIYAGNGYFVHASASHGVTVSNLSMKFYADSLVAIMR